LLAKNESDTHHQLLCERVRLLATRVLLANNFCFIDEGRIATTPDIFPPPYVLKLGQFCFEVPSEDDVKPNFRTPPMVFHIHRGAAANDI
jgi:hypothetical protein